MKPITSILARHLKRSFTLVLLSHGILFSQTSITRQTLTLEVMELNKLAVSRQMLALAPPDIYDSAWDGLSVSATTRLVWTSNGDKRKISVASKQASGTCIVQIDLQGIQGVPGAKSRIRLTDSSTHDVLTGLSRSAGSCALRFSVFLNDPAGVQPHIHVVIYTITGT